MQKSKTHFEQVPLELVKKIAKEDVSDDNDEKNGAVTTKGNSKSKLHRSPSPGKNGKKV